MAWTLLKRYSILGKMEDEKVKFVLMQLCFHLFLPKDTPLALKCLEIELLLQEFIFYKIIYGHSIT